MAEIDPQAHTLDRITAVGWRRLGASLQAWFDAPTYTAGARFLNRVSPVLTAESGDQSLDLDLRPGGVRTRLAVGPSGPTTSDADLAERISRTAAELGLSADPGVLMSMRLVFEANDPEPVIAFWSTAFAYNRQDQCLVDPLRRDPSLWFTVRQDDRPLRNRIHVDVNALHPFTDDRLAALAQAGVHTVRRHEEYGYAVVADVEGNEACLPLRPAARMDHDAGTSDWLLIGAAVVHYPTASPVQSIDLATRVAELCDEFAVTPMIDVRAHSVTIDSGKDQQEDETFDTSAAYRAFAAAVQGYARSLGLRAEPSPPVRFLQLAIDAIDADAVRPFWIAALGYRHDSRFTQDLYDPHRLNPVVWFQDMDPDDDERRWQPSRINIHITVPADRAQARVEAALAAGGRVDVAGPGMWIIADPENNHLQITTT